MPHAAMPNIEFFLLYLNLADVDPLTLTWQSYLILNLAGLLALSFWLGKLSTRVDILRGEVEKLRDWRHDEANVATTLVGLVEIMRDLKVSIKELKEREEKN